MVSPDNISSDDKSFARTRSRITFQQFIFFRMPEHSSLTHLGLNESSVGYSYTVHFFFDFLKLTFLILPQSLWRKNEEVQYYRLDKKKVDKWFASVLKAGKDLRNSNSGSWSEFVFSLISGLSINKIKNEWNNYFLGVWSALSYIVYFSNEEWNAYF